MIDQCQMCGAAITCVEDSDECTVESMFCSVCLGRGDQDEWSSEQVKARLIQSFEEKMDMADEEAVHKAEQIVSELEDLKRSAR